MTTTAQVEATPEIETTLPVERRRWIAVVCAAVAGAIGAVALVGWLAGIPNLTSLATGLSSMKLNTALSLVALGTALVIVLPDRPPRVVGQLLALGVLLLAAGTAVEYLAPVDLGVDNALVRDTTSPALPGRMSLATALGLGCAAGAILMLHSRRVAAPVSYGLALITIAIAGIALIGYLYGVSELYRFGPYASVAAHTALALGVLGVGLVVVQPDPSIIGRALERTPGGVLIRRLVPATIVLPIVLGFVVLALSRAGFYSTEFAVALLVITIIVFMRAFVFRTALAVDTIDLERSRAADLARQAEQRHRLLTDTLPDAIVSIDDSSHIESVNPAAERMFGYPAREIVGRPLTTLMPERFRERHLAALWRYLASGVRTIAWEGTELVGLRRDGVEFPIDVSFAEDTESERRTFTGTIRDISARKSLEAQLVQAQRLESVGRLAGGVAHDFNNILTAIVGFARLTADEMRPGDPNRDKVAAIEEAADRATTLVRQLLAFGRQQMLRPEILELNDVVKRITPMLGRLIGEDVVVLTKLEPRPWPVEADRGQLEQVIVNLVVNARDAMPRGGRLTIESANADLDQDYVRTHPEVAAGHHVMLAVSDTGTGMDAETQARIFEPFFTTKEVGRGSGLGLATVYGIVRQSGGHIWVYSEPGRGTTFRIYFPEAHRPAEEPASLPAAAPAAMAGTETILVAEDEESLRALIETVLRRRGYNVVSASNGADALEIARTREIDLLVTDVVMPGQSGLELAAAVRGLTPAMRVLYISGYTPGALENHGTIGGDMLLQKPFSPDALAQAVRQALDGAE